LSRVRQGSHRFKEPLHTRETVKNDSRRAGR
jgi:hypothetical protein